jgi:ABC-2 type transport system permease protein
MTDGFGLDRILRFKIAIRTMKDNFKIAIILTLLFMGISAMYTGFYPAFEESLLEMMESGFADSFNFLSGAQDMSSYVGFLNLELYQIFWLMILGIIFGFISASMISKEIEGKTFDLLMSNPVSKKQIVFEKFLGLVPMIILINFATMFSVILSTLAMSEELNFSNLFITHLVSIPYFLAVIGIGILISVIINEKMKASITMIAIIVGMFVFNSISLMVPDYDKIGLISITHYFDPYQTLKFGEVDIGGLIVLSVITIWCLIIAMIYFDHKDIAV